MIQTIIVWAIIAVSAFFIGRKFWRSWRAAVSKSQVSCGGCCSCGGGSICPPESNEAKQ